MSVAAELNIAVLPGDGIGDEVMACAERVLAVVARKTNLSLRLQRLPGGAQHYLDSGVALPEETLAACEQADAILFGAMGLPGVRYPDGTEVIPQLDLRFHFDLYAGVRPIRAFAGLPQILAHPKWREIDLVLVRENIEGLFYGRKHSEAHRVDGQIESVRDTMKISRHGTGRICDFAFRLAAKRAQLKGRAGRVTSIDKANVFPSMAFWRCVFEDVSARFPGIAAESAYVDAMALNLVKKPWAYDVLVAENMFGDILSDLIAGLVGGMGMAPSGDIGDTHALFQPAHGTAPDIAGRGIANPTAMILSAAMMLDWLGERTGNARLNDAALIIDAAVEEAYADGGAFPIELGGSHGSDAMTMRFLDRIGA